MRARQKYSLRRDADDDLWYIFESVERTWFFRRIWVRTGRGHISETAAYRALISGALCVPTHYLFPGSPE